VRLCLGFFLEVRRPAARFFHFANVRQKHLNFAKHWQNQSRVRPLDLPSFGKIHRNLPTWVVD
jgi:hypothetical protein